MRLGLACIALASVALAAGTTSPATARAHPLIGEYKQLTTSSAPPSEAQCDSAGRRCFTPSAMRSAYDVAPLYSDGDDGRGQTIAVIDADGSPTMAQDLHMFDQTFGLQPMCGEQDVSCAAGMPGFGVLDLTGGRQGSGADSWALETALDVESAHALAPQANILLVEAPETSDEQGLPGLLDAEQYVIDNHLATVISQSFGTTEQSLGAAAIDRMQAVYASAEAAGITVLASSGDSGAAADWPASDPLVTAVGGTVLCTDPRAEATAPRAYVAGVPATDCAGGQPERAWSGSGGGFSGVFGVPAWQDGLATIGRGIPDVASQASPTTGALIYISGQADGGLQCGSGPCSSGWYVVGGTSLAAPQWAALVALAAQLRGAPLGFLNPALYKLAPGDFYDVTSGSNGGYAAGPGWDPVTGLGTPDAAKLVPDLAAAG
jgi:subtilase family serine protease